MTRRRTYWHLEPLGRKPSEYEVVSSKLLYYVDRGGFEVATPIGHWYKQHQTGSPLACTDWEAFRDPRETTYAKYTELQRRKETYVDGLLQSIETTGYDRRLTPGCLELHDRLVAPLRYPMHGLQMIASYIGSMAPSGRIVIPCLFQAADEIRRIQRIAYRVRQLQAIDPVLGTRSKDVWQRAPKWQPLRQLVEQLLVTYDWGEAFVALNVVVKPALDRLWLGRFGERLALAGDEVTQKIFQSLDEDCAWHRDWTAALLALVDHGPLAGWRERWEPRVAAAVHALEGDAP